VGDDEWNYGDQTYHEYGSHGCVRVPREASEFVYNNYEVGDMVLVRKK
jgi:lipoprotein-anchoring transpeptidase ErfK/SrfK